MYVTTNKQWSSDFIVLAQTIRRNVWEISMSLPPAGTTHNGPPSAPYSERSVREANEPADVDDDSAGQPPLWTDSDVDDDDSDGPPSVDDDSDGPPPLCPASSVTPDHIDVVAPYIQPSVPRRRFSLMVPIVAAPQVVELPPLELVLPPAPTFTGLAFHGPLIVCREPLCRVHSLPSSLVHRVIRNWCCGPPWPIPLAELVLPTEGSHNMLCELVTTELFRAWARITLFRFP